jgi:hypothetical protein
VRGALEEDEISWSLEPVIRPAAILLCATAVLLLPLAAPRFGVAVVVAGIAVGCALLIAFTIAPKFSPVAKPN